MEKRSYSCYQRKEEMDIKKNYKLKKKFSSAWNRICKSASNYKSAFKNKVSLNNMADFKEKCALKGMSVFADGIKRSFDKSSTRAKRNGNISFEHSYSLYIGRHKSWGYKLEQ